MHDKTNYFQSVIHMIKGNLGAGLLGMPVSFKYFGYASAAIALPLLCVISGYCVHILVRSSNKVGKRLNEFDLTYPVMAQRAVEFGPRWLSGASNFVGKFVEGVLLVTQVGVCCVYLIFVVDNTTSILSNYHIHMKNYMVFLAISPFVLALSFIRTLNRLAISSLIANVLQVIGLILILEYLLRNLDQVNLSQRHAFKPINEMALGFGSIMFAFEGISVVLPVYNNLKRREQFGSLCGVINVSFTIILALYFVVGILGYLKYGEQVRDSITLNLPAEPLYDAVRAMFTCSILLSYPLQFYVPNQIIWEWAKENLVGHRQRWNLSDGPSTSNTHKDLARLAVTKSSNLDSIVMPMHSKVGLQVRPDTHTFPTIPNATKCATLKGGEILTDETFMGISASAKKAQDESLRDLDEASKRSISIVDSKIDLIEESNTSDEDSRRTFDIPLRYEYYCRLCVVALTVTLAVSVPKLNLLMDFIGSFSGVCLSLTIPALLHLACYWEKYKGFKKCLMVVIDSSIIVMSITAGLSGSYISLKQILKTLSLSL